MIDLVAIRAHVELLHRLASPLADRGKLVVAGFGEDPNTGRELPSRVRHFDIGDIDGMVEAIAQLAQERHRNVYAPLAVFKKDLGVGKKGEEGDIVGVLAFVGDFDDANAARWPERLPLPASYAIESSSGRFQTFYLFDRPVALKAAKPVAGRLKAFARCDSGTADLSHVWRIPGTPNWPNAKKIAAGRSREPQLARVVVPSNGVLVSLEALAAALPERQSNGLDRGDDLAIDIERLNPAIAELIKEGTINGEKVRSRGPKFMSVVRYLRQRGHSFDAVLALLRAYPNGVQSKYLDEGRLDRELRRAWEKVEAPRNTNLPVIIVVGGSRHENADAGLDALRQAGVPFYKRDRNLVRVAIVDAKSADGKLVKVPTIAPVGLPTLGRALGQCARWNKSNDLGILYDIDPPDAVAKQMLEMFDEWPFPVLLGVIGTPTLRPDGTLLATPGYDPATALFLVDPPPMPTIPENPTRDDAVEALRLLEALICEFPFVFDEDKEQSAAHNPSHSVALSLLMTPVVRGIASVVPAHLISAPAAGTGKSYLADLASALAVGDRCAVLACSPDPTETEKRLIGAALEGRPIIALDNCTDLVAGDFLCQVTERPLMKLRPLGTTDMRTVGNAFTVLINGNNTVVAADMVRRVIKCSLDANEENPEKRKFKRSPTPLADILANRGKYIAAVLTICRAYICANRPERLSATPSFEAWSDLVRSALVWLGKPDPVDTIEELRATDPTREARAQVFDAWVKRLGSEKTYQVSEVIKETQIVPAGMYDQNQEFLNALLTVAFDYKDRQTISPRRLGKWLTKMHKNISGEHKLICDRSDATRTRWQIVRRTQ